MIRVRSGGQTGVDRAALDAALELGLPCGGWCPRGRRAEDGPIPPRYPLRETESADYAVRTERNVRDAEATLILAPALPLSGGTALTARLAERHGRPWRAFLLERDVPALAAAWVAELGIAELNLAGPRASAAPELEARSRAWLRALFVLLGAPAPGAGQGVGAEVDHGQEGP